MEFVKLFTENLRLVALRALAQIPGYSCNDSILQDILATFAIKSSRDQVRGQLAWLQEQGLINYEVLSSGTYVATITQRGLDAATGNVTIPGVKRPSPRD